MSANYSTLSFREQYRIAFQVIRAARGLSCRTRYILEEEDGISVKAIIAARDTYNLPGPKPSLAQRFLALRKQLVTV